MTTLGVLADTHIPDRVPGLHPQVMHIFRQAEVSGILHAGDVITPQVLDELENVAPVQAVRGNRDIFYLRKLPLRIELNIEGVTLGMAHGHHSFTRYMVDKIRRAAGGLPVEGYIQRMLQSFRQADVIVFGHLHRAINLHLEGRLVFNPGSTSYPQPKGEPATVGLLHLSASKEVRGEIITLD
jgi:putative phosphoesterase